MNLPQSAPRIRAAFRSAVAAAGWDFRSDRLWEMYADWERDQGDPRAATAVYDRVLSVPTQLYNQHFHRRTLFNPPLSLPPSSQTDSKLHLALLELELSAGEPGQSEGPVLQCLSHALSCSLPPQTRLLLSRRRLEFQEDFGSSVQRDCEEEDEGEEPEEKVVKSENSPVATPPDHTPVAMPTPPAPLMAGDFNNSQTAYNYGAWYQVM
ncbi:UNVERIFIED_CONTAM: hypothetical protein FKN15_078544 [Acipenser sinensis]